jgi:ribose transport system substrate-binding protein
MKSLRSRTMAGLAIGAALALTITGCSTVGAAKGSTDSGAATSAYMVPKKTEALRIGFSNSFAGNSWRTQMVEELKYAVDTKYKDDVKKLTITDANNSVSAQLSQINDLLTSGIDVLLIDAASATALNGAIDRAHKQGVLVVSFDNAATSEHGIVVNPSQVEFGKVGGEFLAAHLKKGDTVFSLDGAAGSPVNDDRLAGAKKALEAAGISIVAGANTDWDQAKGQAATANLISAHPDVKGIYSQGGAATLGALNALKQRGTPLMPITGEGYNGFLKVWKKLSDEQGFTSVAPSNPPSLSVTALDIAIKAIRGEDPGQAPAVELPVITQENLKDYVREDLSDSLWLPTSLPEDVLQRLYKQ